MPASWRTPRRERQARHAFTLVEVLVVLALLVIFAAISAPLVKGPLENYRLRKSADTIRSAFASARATAARTGLTYIFQLKPETGEYTIEPWMTGDEYLEVSNSSTIDLGAAQGAAPTIQPIKTTPLPKGIVFHGVITESSVRDLRTISNTGNTASAIASAPTSAKPILFYSDGSCSNATVMIKNERGAYIQIRLRGLTGHSTATDLLSASQASGS